MVYSDCMYALLKQNLRFIFYHGSYSALLWNPFDSPTYSITVTEIRVGRSLIDSQFDALFDSGTSFTYMMDPAYAQLSESVSI